MPVSALRKRTRFAMPLVVVVSCGHKETSTEITTVPPPKVGGSTQGATADKLDGPRWTIWQNGTTCRAEVVMDFSVGADHGPPPNPPPPRAIVCPTGVALPVAVVEKPDKTCVVVPNTCTSLTCATVATPCPEPFH
jgi:hypothetical protein